MFPAHFLESLSGPYIVVIRHGTSTFLLGGDRGRLGGRRPGRATHSLLLDVALQVCLAYGPVLVSQMMHEQVP